MLRELAMWGAVMRSFVCESCGDLFDAYPQTNCFCPKCGVGHLYCPACSYVHQLSASQKDHYLNRVIG